MFNFSKEKEDLLQKSLAVFDRETIANNVPGLQKIKTDCTFLLHILIETLCCFLEKDNAKRQQLFKCVCSSLTEQKYLDPMVYENLAPIRREYASKFYEHIRKVHSTLAPSSLQQGAYSELDDSLVIQQTYIKYKDMFDEIQIIGKGGFGIVCKARHKVDNMVYAVKKIIFTYQKDSDYNKVMREVKSFAGLSHMNVVGYNNAWVQTVEQSEVLTESSSTSDSSSGECDPVEFSGTSTPLYRDSNRCSESDSILFYASTTQEVDSRDSSFEASSLDEDIHPKLNFADHPPLNSVLARFLRIPPPW
ncbi:eukaryotic translation initiation factor 2-alpha kinase 1 [Trichonephila inaurata madagascariensis]|uniref:non-specific serine/threonine protein kinase n=1 Tax=Trichonephila inaurata madagascariensis TaxID=2747483 RepID=A0A8X7CHU6_9ARAC|nr:eukaryotic translation initiation factor 2-alpha kinase 1 [Trichonephila inaurata madagascariensis]